MAVEVEEVCYELYIPPKDNLKPIPGQPPLRPVNRYFCTITCTMLNPFSGLVYSHCSQLYPQRLPRHHPHHVNHNASYSTAFSLTVSTVDPLAVIYLSLGISWKRQSIYLQITKEPWSSLFSCGWSWSPGLNRPTTG